MRIELKTVNGTRALDAYNQAGYWIGWAKEIKGVLTLQSTGAPLTEDERSNLASSIANALNEMVAS